MKYYKNSKKRQVISTVIVLVIIGCMVATTLLAIFM